MEILSLTTESYRNLAPETVELHPRLNLVVGDNGQGKTSLLEAVALVGGRASFRTSDLRLVVAGGATRACVAVRRAAAPEAGPTVVAVDLAPGRRDHYADGRRVPQLAAREALPSVFLTGEDLDRLCGPPSERRRAVDRAALALSGDHARAAAAYERARSAKARLLCAARPPDPTQLDVLDETLAREGARVAARRRRAVAQLQAGLSRAAGELGSPFAPLSLRLVGDLPADGDEASFEALLLAALSARREEERRAGRCLVGPHRDDAVLLAGELPVSGRASSGESRTLLLAWTLAELRLLEAGRGRTPLLAFDDFDSEWDPGALRRFAEALPAGGQVLLTSARPEAVRSLPFPPGLVHRVERGALRPDGEAGAGRVLRPSSGVWGRREARA